MKWWNPLQCAFAAFALISLRFVRFDYERVFRFMTVWYWGRSRDELYHDYVQLVKKLTPIQIDSSWVTRVLYGKAWSWSLCRRLEVTVRRIGADSGNVSFPVDMLNPHEECRLVDYFVLVKCLGKLRPDLRSALASSEQRLE